jgi:hypothetical protein
MRDVVIEQLQARVAELEPVGGDGEP